MNLTALVALIGASGVVIGAVLSFLASAFSARQKIKELELTYRQKLEENYISNARSYIDTVYMPTNISLSNLESSFYDFKTNIGLHDKNSEEFKRACENFRESCEKFNQTIFDLLNRGEDAHLTTKLEVSLRSFNNFIRNSRLTTKHSMNLSSRIKWRFPRFEEVLFDASAEDTLDRDKEAKLLRRIQRFDPMAQLINSTPLRLSMYIQVNIIMLAAPITSLVFEKRLSADIPIIKSFIKEITLGTSAIPSKEGKIK